MGSLTVAVAVGGKEVVNLGDASKSKHLTALAA